MCGHAYRYITLVSSISQATLFTFNNHDNIQVIGTATETLVNIGDPRKPPVRTAWELLQLQADGLLTACCPLLQIYLGLEGYGSSDRDLSYIQVRSACSCAGASSRCLQLIRPSQHCSDVPATGLLI